MKLDLKNHKICVFGIQGSGKSVLTKYLVHCYKRPVIFSVNKDDGYQDLKRAWVYRPSTMDYKAEFELFIKSARQWAHDKKIDAIIIEEADLFFMSNYDINPEMMDIALNHRHMGVAVIFVTRRPQDIPTRIVESSRYLFIFKLEGVNAIERFKEIDAKIPPMIKTLEYDRHNFIYKELGRPPILHQPIVFKG